jgi:hypothetical protein
MSASAAMTDVWTMLRAPRCSRVLAGARGYFDSALVSTVGRARKSRMIDSIIRTFP